MAKFKILAIDGGGIRGIYAAHILKRIKEELNIDYCKDFDLIVGTSTGSIIAGALATGVDIADIFKFYAEYSAKIFQNIWINGWVWSLFFSRYSKSNLIQLLNKIFSEKTFSNTKTNLIIPATDVSNGTVFVFKSPYNNSFVRDKNIKIADAVLASCSAPTYFNPSKINEYMLADGGLWANNPALVAFTEATGKYFQKNKEDVKILSVGTGIGKYYYNPADYNSMFWGFLFKWKNSTFIDLLLNIQSINVNNILNLIMAPDNYLRINFESDLPLKLDSAKVIPELLKNADKDFTYNSLKIINFFKEE